MEHVEINSFWDHVGGLGHQHYYSAQNDCFSDVRFQITGSLFVEDNAENKENISVVNKVTGNSCEQDVNNNNANNTKCNFPNNDDNDEQNDAQLAHVNQNLRNELNHEESQQLQINEAVVVAGDNDHPSISDDKAPPFKLGDIVFVQERRWPGINREGGDGRISAVNSDGTYNLKYFHNGREDDVAAEYIQRPVEQPRKRESVRGICRNPACQFRSYIRDCGCVQPKPDEVSEGKTDDDNGVPMELIDAPHSDNRSPGNITVIEADHSQRRKRPRNEIDAPMASDPVNQTAYGEEIDSNPQTERCRKRPTIARSQMVKMTVDESMHKGLEEGLFEVESDDSSQASSGVDSETDESSDESSDEASCASDESQAKEVRRRSGPPHGISRAASTGQSMHTLRKNRVSSSSSSRSTRSGPISSREDELSSSGTGAAPVVGQGSHCSRSHHSSVFFDRGGQHHSRDGSAYQSLRTASAAMSNQTEDERESIEMLSYSAAPASRPTLSISVPSSSHQRSVFILGEGIIVPEDMEERTSYINNLKADKLLKLMRSKRGEINGAIRELKQFQVRWDARNKKIAQFYIDFDRDFNTVYRLHYQRQICDELNCIHKRFKELIKAGELPVHITKKFVKNLERKLANRWSNNVEADILKLNDSLRKEQEEYDRKYGVCCKFDDSTANSFGDSSEDDGDETIDQSDSERYEVGASSPQMEISRPTNSQITARTVGRSHSTSNHGQRRIESEETADHSVPERDIHREQPSDSNNSRNHISNDEIVRSRAGSRVSQRDQAVFTQKNTATIIDRFLEAVCDRKIKTDMFCIWNRFLSTAVSDDTTATSILKTTDDIASELLDHFSVIKSCCTQYSDLGAHVLIESALKEVSNFLIRNLHTSNFVQVFITLCDKEFPFMYCLEQMIEYPEMYNCTYYRLMIRKIAWYSKCRDKAKGIDKDTQDVVKRGLDEIRGALIRHLLSTNMRLRLFETFHNLSTATLKPEELPCPALLLYCTLVDVERDLAWDHVKRFLISHEKPFGRSKLQTEEFWILLSIHTFALSIFDKKDDSDRVSGAWDVLRGCDTTCLKRTVQLAVLWKSPKEGLESFLTTCSNILSNNDETADMSVPTEQHEQHRHDLKPDLNCINDAVKSLVLGSRNDYEINMSNVLTTFLNYQTRHTIVYDSSTVKKMDGIVSPLELHFRKYLDSALKKLPTDGKRDTVAKSLKSRWLLCHNKGSACILSSTKPSLLRVWCLAELHAAAMRPEGNKKDLKQIIDSVLLSSSALTNLNFRVCALWIIGWKQVRSLCNCTTSETVLQWYNDFKNTVLDALDSMSSSVISNQNDPELSQVMMTMRLAVIFSVIRRLRVLANDISEAFPTLDYTLANPFRKELKMCTDYCLKVVPQSRAFVSPWFVDCILHIARELSHKFLKLINNVKHSNDPAVSATAVVSTGPEVVDRISASGANSSLELFILLAIDLTKWLREVLPDIIVQLKNDKSTWSWDNYKTWTSAMDMTSTLARLTVFLTLADPRTTAVIEVFNFMKKNTEDCIITSNAISTLNAMSQGPLEVWLSCLFWIPFLDPWLKNSVRLSTFRRELQRVLWDNADSIVTFSWVGCLCLESIAPAETKNQTEKFIESLENFATEAARNANEGNEEPNPIGIIHRVDKFPTKFLLICFANCIQMKALGAYVNESMLGYFLRKIYESYPHSSSDKFFMWGKRFLTYLECICLRKPNSKNDAALNMTDAVHELCVLIANIVVPATPKKLPDKLAGVLCSSLPSCRETQKAMVIRCVSWFTHGNLRDWQSLRDKFLEQSSSGRTSADAHSFNRSSIMLLALSLSIPYDTDLRKVNPYPAVVGGNACSSEVLNSIIKGCRGPLFMSEDTGVTRIDSLHKLASLKLRDFRSSWLCDDGLWCVLGDGKDGLQLRMRLIIDVFQLWATNCPNCSLLHPPPVLTDVAVIEQTSALSVTIPLTRDELKMSHVVCAVYATCILRIAAGEAPKSEGLILKTGNPQTDINEYIDYLVSFRGAVESIHALDPETSSCHVFSAFRKYIHHVFQTCHSLSSSSCSCEQLEQAAFLAKDLEGVLPSTNRCTSCPNCPWKSQPKFREIFSIFSLNNNKLMDRLSREYQVRSDVKFPKVIR